MLRQAQNPFADLEQIWQGINPHRMGENGD
jgi:hypothetical protein